MALDEWVRNNALTNRITVSAFWPEPSCNPASAVIVANRARDHFDTAVRALQFGNSVLVEKPIATSLLDALELQRFSSKCGKLLVAGHVFRFTRYLENFSKITSSLSNIKSVVVNWVDGKDEYRFGETKHYDCSIPVFVDCIPHIVSILQTVFNTPPKFGCFIKTTNGGAKVELKLFIEKTPCHVTLQRNGRKRIRRIVVNGANGPVWLDFSEEPGFIQTKEGECLADSDWETKPRPLHLMLASFMTAATGGSVDERLSLETAICSAAISDKLLPVYQSSIVSCLFEKIKTYTSVSDETSYLISEIVQQDIKHLFGTEEIKIRFEKLKSGVGLLKAEDATLLLNMVRNYFEP